MLNTEETIRPENQFIRELTDDNADQAAAFVALSALCGALSEEGSSGRISTEQFNRIVVRAAELGHDMIEGKPVIVEMQEDLGDLVRIFAKF